MGDNLSHPFGYESEIYPQIEIIKLNIEMRIIIIKLRNESVYE